jgi:hypothetical protein
MAKLKSSFGKRGGVKLPNLMADKRLPGTLLKTAVPKDVSGQNLKITNAGLVVQALGFGALHTKVTGSGNSSQWSGLLGAAATGGSSSLLSGGLLSNGALGFVGKLLSLFGGHKSTPAAPTPFVMPASQQQTLNVGSAVSGSSVSLGLQSSPNSGSHSGPLYQTGSMGNGHSTQSAQVVQIVKQALLTSSSLNDVISEI